MKKKPFRLRDARKRYHVYFLLVLCAFVVLTGRLFWMQIVDGGEMSRRSAAQTTDKIRRNTPRGRIVDRNGEELAVSIMVHSLYVNQEQDQRQDRLPRIGPKQEFLSHCRPSSAGAGGRESRGGRVSTPCPDAAVKTAAQ